MSEQERLDHVQVLAARAVAAGGEVVSPRHVQWDISGRCSNGFTVDRFGRADVDSPVAQERLHREMGRINRTCWVELTTPCRTCEACRRARQALWRRRASQEIANAERTWFGTLTLSPEAHQVILDRVRVSERERGATDFDALPKAEQFRVRSAEALTEVTLWLKRVRKAEGPFRYLVVTEAHESGLPHFHCLVHERGNPVRHRTLVSKWRLGFSNFKLVDASTAGAAHYVSKYLAKSALARVRASERYGNIAAWSVDPAIAPLGHNEVIRGINEVLNFDHRVGDSGSQPGTDRHG